jgi:hypothetical protein
VKDALNAIDNPGDTKQRDLDALNAIQNNSEESLLDKYEKFANRDLSNPDKAEQANQNLSNIQKRRDALARRSALLSKLDNIHQLKVALNELKEYNASSGKFIVPPDIDVAAIKKAAIDSRLGKPISVGNIIRSGLQDSNLLSSDNIPNGFEDLKNYKDQYIPTGSALKLDFQQNIDPEVTKPIENNIQDSEVSNRMKTIDQQYKDLGIESDEVIDAQPWKDLVKKAISCFSGEA